MERRLYGANQVCKGSDDICAAGREPALVCARLEPKPPAESPVASACAVSRRAAAVSGGRSVDHRDVAAMAQVQRAGGGVQSRGGRVGRLLDSVVLYSVFVAVFDVVGGKVGSGAAYRWRDGLPESGGCRSVSFADGRGIPAVEN